MPRSVSNEIQFISLIIPNIWCANEAKEFPNISGVNSNYLYLNITTKDPKCLMAITLFNDRSVESSATFDQGPKSD